MFVDHLLLRRRHAVVLRLVHRIGEDGRKERHVHVVLGDLVEAEQKHRAPREEDAVGHTALQHVARLRRRSLHVGAAQHGHHLPDRALRRADFHALDVLGQHHFLAAMIAARLEHEGEAEVRVLHLLRGVLTVPGIERRRALLGVGEHEGQLSGRDDGKATWLVTRIDISDVGNAVARHVVVVERLAELLGGEDRRLDGAVRGLLDVGCPFLGRRHQRMGGRQPDRDFQVHCLVLGERRRTQQADRQRQSELFHWAVSSDLFVGPTYRAMTRAPTAFIAPGDG